MMMRRVMANCRLSATISTSRRGETVAAARPSPPLATVISRGMAGHSKWAKIKRQKGDNDAKRAQAFAKITREITEASRLAKGDMHSIRLAAAISRAKALNVPKDTVTAAVKRGVEAKAGADMETVLYEGHGPASVAIVVEALTDNRKRTAANIRHIFSKYGGALGTTGSVTWMFERKGLVEVDKKAIPSGKDLIETALNAGADDVEEDEEEDAQCTARVYCPPQELAALRKGLEENDFVTGIVELLYQPKTLVGVSSEEDSHKLSTMLDALDEDPDVQNVFHNAEDQAGAKH